MKSEQLMVREFHKEFGLLINNNPTIIPDSVVQLRERLIKEELDELVIAALSEPNLVDIADALADLLYVVLGTAVSFGIDIEPVFAEVHRSNMTKKGGHLRSDGKWIKPDTYSPADLISIIESQKGK